MVVVDHGAIFARPSLPIQTTQLVVHQVSLAAPAIVIVIHTMFVVSIAVSV
jgi:hypothetical protein